MNAEQWREVKSVLQQAMDTPSAERQAFIEVACRDRPELRHEVQSLLAAHVEEEAAGDPLQDAVDAGFRAAARPARDLSDDQLRAMLQAGLGEQFDVLGTLGSGGMGSVFLAHELALDRTVAIKVLRPDRAATPGSRERFRREARIAAQLSHAGIVPLYSFGEVNGLWYFVMEYVRGPSLAQRLENEHRLPPDEVRGILLAIAEALEHAHQRGVVHRDVKPANILLDEDAGHPRLADFGISKVEGSSDDITLTGTYLGTPLYMSPEQADGATAVDGRSDIYSLGAVAYAMLTGHAPFTGANAADVLTRRQVEEPTPILDIVPRLPVDLANVVMRCLHRDRDARWRDATALRSALRSSSLAASSELPQAIADLPGYAAYALAWMVFWTAFALGTDRSPTSRALLILLAILVPVGPALHIWRVRAHGMSAGQLSRLVLRPPKWWGTWWPARLRSADDLWLLLPPIARTVRTLVAVFFILLALVALTSDRGGGVLSVVRNVAAALLIVGTPVAIAMVWRWANREELGFDRTMQFLFASSMPAPFWKEPQVARLLAPAANSVRPPHADVASDHARAVEELVRRFPATIEQVGRLALRAVQHQVASIASVDREIALLARDASPTEANRLAMRLTSLTEGETASPEHRELGDTVRRQLELIRKIQGQHSLALARRTALLMALRAVWSQLTALVDAEREGEAAVRDAEERVRALCARILNAGEAPPR